MRYRKAGDWKLILWILSAFAFGFLAAFLIHSAIMLIRHYFPYGCVCGADYEAKERADRLAHGEPTGNDMLYIGDEGKDCVCGGFGKGYRRRSEVAKHINDALARGDITEADVKNSDLSDDDDDDEDSIWDAIKTQKGTYITFSVKDSRKPPFWA